MFQGSWLLLLLLLLLQLLVSCSAPVLSIIFNHHHPKSVINVRHLTINSKALSLNCRLQRHWCENRRYLRTQAERVS